MLHKFLKAQKEKPQEMNDANVLSMSTSNIFAGSDTTAISTRAIISFLLKNPECKRKRLDKIDTMKKDGRLTKPVTYEQAENMPYLQGCIYEALRLHPAVGMSLPRITPPGGIHIDGRHIPEGVSVEFSPCGSC